MLKCAIFVIILMFIVKWMAAEALLEYFRYFCFAFLCVFSCLMCYGVIGMVSTVAFTGLRSKKLSFGTNESHADCLRLKELILKNVDRLIREKNARHFISGMAMGADQICSQIVIELKKQHNNITLEAAIPCSNQDKLWPQKYKDEYKRLLLLCDECHHVSTRPYFDGCMIQRNNYMVEKADYLISIWDGSTGGTSSTVKSAWQKGIPVIIIDPLTFTVKWGRRKN